MNASIRLLTIAAAVALTGCASVNMAPAGASDQAKQFKAPAKGNAGLYLYRTSGVGQSLHKDLWVDSRCVGKSAPNVFFYTEIKGGLTHTISTQSEMSPNHLQLRAEAGKLYFVRQYMKMGLFVGGANLEQIDEAQGRQEVSALALAQGNDCDSPTPGARPSNPPMTAPIDQNRPATVR